MPKLLIIAAICAGIVIGLLISMAVDHAVKTDVVQITIQQAPEISYTEVQTDPVADCLSKANSRKEIKECLL